MLPVKKKIPCLPQVHSNKECIHGMLWIFVGFFVSKYMTHSSLYRSKICVPFFCMKKSPIKYIFPYFLLRNQKLSFVYKSSEKTLWTNIIYIWYRKFLFHFDRRTVLKRWRGGWWRSVGCRARSSPPSPSQHESGEHVTPWHGDTNERTPTHWWYGCANTHNLIWW